MRPTVVDDFWLFIKQCVEGSLPVGVQQSMDMEKVRKALLIEAMHCWIVWIDKVIACVATTGIAEDGFTGNKTLSIFSMFNPGWVAMNESAWIALFEKAKVFCAKKGIRHINAVTSNPQMIALVNKMGGSTERRFVTLEV